MANGVSIRWEFDHLPTLLSQLDVGTAVALDTVLARIERDAKAGAPVRTGALRASGFRITPLFNDYGMNTARAMTLNPQMKAVTNFGWSFASRQFIVGFSADYAVFVHDGSRGRAGRPFLMEAVMRHSGEFEGALRTVIDSLASGGTATPVGLGG